MSSATEAAAARGGGLLALAFDARVEPPDDPMSRRVLDAALAAAAASGLRNLTMDDVARRAGVGRMTVYRRFGERDRLIEALSVRETRRCLAELEAAATPEEPIVEQVAAGFAASLRMAREHPLLNRLARHEPETVLAAFRDEGGAVLATAREFLAGRLRASQAAGVLGPEVVVEEAAELLVRLAVSFVLVQDTVLAIEDEEGAREVARRLIAPVVEG